MAESRSSLGLFLPLGGRSSRSRAGLPGSPIVASFNLLSMPQISILSSTKLICSAAASLKMQLRSTSISWRLAKGKSGCKSDTYLEYFIPLQRSSLKGWLACRKSPNGRNWLSNGSSFLPSGGGIRKIRRRKRKLRKSFLGLFKKIYE